MEELLQLIKQCLNDNYVVTVAKNPSADCIWVSWHPKGDKQSYHQHRIVLANAEQEEVFLAGTGKGVKIV